MPVIILIILVIAFVCAAVDDGIRGVWKQLTAIGVDNKLSLEVTGIEIEDDLVTATVVVTNNDSRPHMVCVYTLGTLTGITTEYTYEPSDRVVFGDSSNFGCDDVGEHSSKIFTPGVREGYHDSEIIESMRRDGYKNFKVCGDIVEVDNVETFSYGRLLTHKHCALFSGP